MSYDPNATVAINALAWSLALDAISLALDQADAAIDLLRSRVVALESAVTPTPETGGVVVSQYVRQVSGTLADQFSISRTGDTSGPRTATWQAGISTLPGRVATRTADFGGSYPTGTVTWAAGATDVKTVTVTPTNSNVLPE